ncbi:hypothetical protein LT330_003032 [Penicillium expansum]|nr:hypothetical protein LT330_003032 [Penicillium expansum]
MYGLKQLSLLSLMLLSVSAEKNSKRTIVGIETADKSRGIDVPLNDCHAIEEEDVLTVSLKKPCRLFTGPDCTGHNTFLSPGDHSSKDPIPVIESIFLEVAEQLKVQKGITARVVSFPCQRLFEKQSVDYKRNPLQRHRGIPAVVIEPYALNGWERLPGKAAHEFFGYEVSKLTTKVARYLKRLQEDELLHGEVVNL